MGRLPMTKDGLSFHRKNSWKCHQVSLKTPRYVRVKNSWRWFDLPWNRAGFSHHKNSWRRLPVQKKKKEEEEGIYRYMYLVTTKTMSPAFPIKQSASSTQKQLEMIRLWFGSPQKNLEPCYLKKTPSFCHKNSWRWSSFLWKKQACLPKKQLEMSPDLLQKHLVFENGNGPNNYWRKKMASSCLCKVGRACWPSSLRGQIHKDNVKQKKGRVLYGSLIWTALR